MKLALTATSLHEALDHLRQPYVSAVVLNADLITQGSHHQAGEVFGEASQQHKTVYIVFALSSVAKENLFELHRQLLSLWNRSHAVIPVLPYSPIALEKSHWAAGLGLPLHMYNLSTLAESLASVESGASGGWISLSKSLDHREKNATGELLTQLESIAQDDGYLVVATDVETNEQLEFATEFGAELATVSPELIFRRNLLERF